MSSLGRHFSFSGSFTRSRLRSSGTAAQAGSAGAGRQQQVRPGASGERRRPLQTGGTDGTGQWRAQPAEPTCSNTTAAAVPCSTTPLNPPTCEVLEEEVDDLGGAPNAVPGSTPPRSTLQYHPSPVRYLRKKFMILGGAGAHRVVKVAGSHPRVALHRGQEEGGQGEGGQGEEGRMLVCVSVCVCS